MGEKNNEINENHPDLWNENESKEDETLSYKVKIRSPFNVTTKCQKEIKCIPEEESIVNLEIEILPQFLMVRVESEL